ncbi:Subtilase family protein [Cyclonatronum proteinivorum]|uniref:Subtilase family protein n=1 Tax=Cyclonatronum proteinivorum TaxID=1457365 RepID=A0A345UNT9_9BACT|nr:S8/S53 family peptidase [Cyclonatronum proteinivorum]AXJ02141.1 Subtilase family protein [Cyclonatronum proteinivorum]
MKTYKLIAAGLLTLCFSISLWHSEVFSSIPETTAEVTAQSAVQPDTTGKHRLVQLARERGMVRIGVTYNMEHSPERYLGGGQRNAQRQQIAQMHDAFVHELQNKRLNVNIGGKLETYPRIFLSVDEEALLYLYKSELVKSIDVVRRGQRFLSESTTLVGSQNANMLDIDGTGETIVIMDDGVDSSHGAFSGRVNVNNGACFSENDSSAGLSSLCPGGAETAFGFDAGEPCDDFDVECDHGTHVAGIAAGENGVAPGAEIVSFQVFSKTVPDACEDEEDENAPCLTWSDETLEQALDHLNTRPWLSDVTAINMSFGFIDEDTPFTQACDDENTTVTDLIADIFQGSQGAYVVAASGNEGFSNEAAFPACISSVISVGATDNNDEHWQQSNAASYLDLVAPGVDITSAMPGGGTTEKTGTSMAAPHVSGTLALISQAYPMLTPAQVQEKLYDNLEKVSGMQGQPRTDEYGRGRLNAYASVLDALEQNPSVTLIEQSQNISGTETYYNDEYIYVLPGATLNVNGTLNLNNAFLYVLGTLEGSGTINLIGVAEIIDEHGINNFTGTIGDGSDPPPPAYPTVSDTTFTQNTVLADTLMLTGVTTLDPGVTVTVAENNLIIIADTLQMNGSGSSISIFASSGELRLSEGIHVNGGRLVAHSEGEIDIEEEAMLQSTSLTIHSGGKAIIGDDADINTNGGNIVIDPGAELQVRDNVTFGLDSATLRIRGDAVIGDSFTFTNGHISTSSSSSLSIGNGAQLDFAETPAGMFTRGQGFEILGEFSILGNGTMQPYNNQSGGWHGLSLIGNGANGSSVSNAQISGSTHGVRLIGVQDINLSGTQITNHQTAGLFISGSDDINLYEIIVSGSENDGMVTNSVNHYSKFGKLGQSI